jgi:hypothetical protein
MNKRALLIFFVIYITFGIFFFIQSQNSRPVICAPSSQAFQEAQLGPHAEVNQRSKPNGEGCSKKPFITSKEIPSALYFIFFYPLVFVLKVANQN